MTKLTVFFKDKIICSYLSEKNILHIGRDETNDLTINSMAVAPAHAAIIIRDDGSSTIKQLNDNFPLIINGEKIKKFNLNNNDMISMGNHYIVYNSTESEDQTESLINKEDATSLNHEIISALSIPAANLQVIDGENIGKVLPLKKAMTRLGHSGNGVAVISKRKNGYFISALENIDAIMVNSVPVCDSSVRLNHNDVLIINNTSMQFFLN